MLIICSGGTAIMEIQKENLKKIFGAQEAQAYENAIVNLFVVSAKYPRIKKLSLEGLEPEQRQAKLHHWAESHRFVAVVELGDQVFAHVHADFAAQLELQLDLAIDGKPITIKALTSEESALLDAVGKTFANQVISEEEMEEDEKEDKTTDTTSVAPRQYYAKRLLVSDQVYVDHWIAKIGNIPSKVITNVLKQFSEAREQDQKIQKEKAERDRILKNEIGREILAGEVKKSEINHQSLKIESTVEDMHHANFARGGEHIL